MQAELTVLYLHLSSLPIQSIFKEKIVSSSCLIPKLHP